MISRYAPIPCPRPDQRKPGPHIMPPVLEFARAVPDHAAMDETADWMHNGGREALEGMLVVDCPEAAR